jgi:hypothetical protein
MAQYSTFSKTGIQGLICRKNTGHWHGGEPEHNNARCFVCKKPLRLVWSLLLADTILPDSLRNAFTGLSRLPLYYCFNCPEATTYQVKSDDAIKTLNPAGHDGGDETPYACQSEVPPHLPRRPIALTRIPSIIDGLTSLEIGFCDLDIAGQRTLSKYVGKKLHSDWDVVFSQFGGSPTLVQGHWDMNCPNPRCSGKKYEGNSAFQLKELAVIEQDCIDGFSWAYAPLAYHLCWVCGTIQGNFRCS